MAKTNYNKMAKIREPIDVPPVAETTSLDEKPVVEEAIAPEEPVVETKPENKIQKGIVVDCLKLNVRNNPHPNAAIELTIDKGTEVEIVGSNGDFYNVRKGTTTEGFSGWCMKKYISIK